MIPTLMLTLSLTPGVDAFGGAKSDPLGPKAYPTVYVPAEAPHGYLYQPAVDLHTIPRLPCVKYAPSRAMCSCSATRTPALQRPLGHRPQWEAGPPRPGRHDAGSRPRLGMLEAGFGFTPWTRLTPLDYGINVYRPGNVWVRQHRSPPDSGRRFARLTEFAVLADGGEYDLRNSSCELTLIRWPQPDRDAQFTANRSDPARNTCAFRS